MGQDYRNPHNQTGFRVLYYPEISSEDNDLVQDFSFLQEKDPKTWWKKFKTSCDYKSPFKSPCSITFKPSKQFITANDCHFKLDREDISAIDTPHYDDEDFFDIYFEHFGGEGHRIGGYPSFTQDDPRSSDKSEIKNYIQLIQLDSDEHITWGDSGLAHLFIHPDDLRRRDFSKVIYYWDCA